MASPGFDGSRARRSRRRRRDHRDAKGAEWGGVWGGVSTPQPTRGLGERRELPSGVWGRAPAAIAFSAYFMPQNASRSKKNTVIRRLCAFDQAPSLRTACDEPFACRGRLNSRKQAHSPVNVYICSECQKRFSTKQVLMQHVNIHTDNYKCTECGRCCKSGSELCLWFVSI